MKKCILVLLGLVLVVQVDSAETLGIQALRDHPLKPDLRVWRLSEVETFEEELHSDSKISDGLRTRLIERRKKDYQRLIGLRESDLAVLSKLTELPSKDESGPVYVSIAPVEDSELFKIVGLDLSGVLEGVDGLHGRVISKIGDDASLLLASLEDLRFLCLGGTSMTDEGLQNLSALKSLECLVTPNEMTDKGLQLLGGLPNLRRLSLSVSGKVLGAGFETWPRSSLVEEIELHFDMDADLSLSHINQFENIKKVTASSPARLILYRGNLAPAESELLRGGKLSD